MKLTKRELIKLGLAYSLESLFSLPGFASDLEQRIMINLPAYTLTLLNGEFEEYTFPVAIGKGYDGKKQTPINTGHIEDKRRTIVLRYGKDYPHLKIKERDIIRWTNTYDKNGKPIGYRIPNHKMRGLPMKIKNGNSYYEAFVIHSTTDEFTVGTPASGGCIRVGVDDMLKLYGLVEPGTKRGKLKKPVPVNISYDLVELKGKDLILHANIYNKNKSYLLDFLKETINAGFPPILFNYDTVKELFISALKDFHEAHNQILDKLSKNFPHNYIEPSLKERLHKTYKLSTFFKDTVIS